MHHSNDLSLVLSSSIHTHTLTGAAHTCEGHTALETQTFSPWEELATYGVDENSDSTFLLTPSSDFNSH